MPVLRRPSRSPRLLSALLLGILAQHAGAAEDLGWRTLPWDLPERLAQAGLTPADLACATPAAYGTVPAPARSLDYAALSGFLTPLPGTGPTRLRWADHQRHPTVRHEGLAGDWRGVGALRLTMTSAVATGDVITVAIRAEDPATPARDWWVCDLAIDWAGPRTVDLPLATFRRLNHPLGWGGVQEIALFSKAFGHQPCPATVLDLGAPETVPGTPGNQVVVTPPAFPVRHRFHEQPTPANHPFPEIVQPAPVFAPGNPVVHGDYFDHDRGMYAYYPRFQPGYVSVAPSGATYVVAGSRIQWLGADGRWTHSDLTPTLEAWARAEGWPGVQINDAPKQGEPMIRFDRDGDAYTVRRLNPIGPQGPVTDRHAAVLLHSRDGLRTWTPYRIPGGALITFEKIDGHNPEALEHPPVMLVGDADWNREAGTTAALVVPSKRPDGTLDLGLPIPYADNAIVGSMHSGDANQMLSIGGKVVIVWGWCPKSTRFPEVARTMSKPGEKISEWGGGSWTWERLRMSALGPSLPPIPANHPALGLTYHRHRQPSLALSREGVPTFVSVWDRATRLMAPPVFVGFGGNVLDAHNNPAITADAQGTFTILINGHHDPLMEVRSLRPRDPSAWTAPVAVNDGTADLSYAAVITDRRNQLVAINRYDEGERSTLGLTRRRPDGTWEKDRVLVWPAHRGYMAWSHKLTYDPRRDRLYLTYYANGSSQSMAQDRYEFFVFQHPDQEAVMAANQGKKGWQNNQGRLPVMPKPLSSTGFAGYETEMTDGSILISDDQGDHWRLATTDDFR